MKRIISIIMAMIMLFSATACSKQDKSWQEQYDLGMRYLSEMDYENAILAFNSAIEIDPRQMPAYIALADVYTAKGDREKARQVIARGEERTGETANINNDPPHNGAEDFEFTIYPNINDYQLNITDTREQYGEDENGNEYLWLYEEKDEEQHITKSTFYHRHPQAVQYEISNGKTIVFYNSRGVIDISIICNDVWNPETVNIHNDDGTIAATKSTSNGTGGYSWSNDENGNIYWLEIRNKNAEDILMIDNYIMAN